MPIPDASLGLAAYTLEFILNALGGAERWRAHRRLVLFSGALIAGLVVGSFALVLIQAFFVKAWCLLCLASAAISTAIAGLAAPEVWKAWTSH